MTTALAIVAKNTGASEEDISGVIKGMIISSKGQHGATATNAEIAVFTGVCSKYALNPLVKECAAFVSGGKLQVIVMIDGWYKMVNRQESFDGVEFDDHLNDKGEVTAITCRMYIKGRSRPVAVTEYLNECFDPKSSVWKRWPARMLRHKAYIQAARIAFGISEVIDDDEASRIDSKPMAERDITPQPSVDLKAIDRDMAECGDLETLKSVCGDIREKMQGDNTWSTFKSEVIALNVKHKDRIGALIEEEAIEEAEPSPAEEIEGELLPVDDKAAPENDNVGFGDDDKDEFGE